MRMLKRVVWFCFAGCCCAGLMLAGGEQVQSTTSGDSAYASQQLCPVACWGMLGGGYYYTCVLNGDSCNPPQYYAGYDTRMHQVAPCGSCPDPIVGPATQPIAIDPEAPVPQPDPLFSGVLR